MADELQTSFLAAFQASLSVLLVISYGVGAAQFDIIQGSTTKQISALCVRVFLPALLLTNVGSQLHADTAFRYVPILIWSLFYLLTSMLVGYILTRVFKLPSWVTPAITFNNTTGLPLLLIQSLNTTGVLESLLMSESDTTSEALLRAKSYFLVNAMIADSLTFALGPKLLDGEEVPENERNGEQNKPNGGHTTDHQNEEHDSNVSIGQSQPRSSAADADEHTSLLPNFVVRGEEVVSNRTATASRKTWAYLPSYAQRALHFSYAFLHAPLIGAVCGAIIGLVPALHKAFFASAENGGIFRAWLTDSIKNIGELFPALQIVVVGVKLSSSMRKMKRGEDSGDVPWATVVLVTVIRFVIWPAISIAVIYGFTSKTTLLGNDPMLWFAMVLIPTGPTAMKLTAVADVSGSSEGEKMSIAKFLSITYAVSPLICFTVVGALKVCHAASGT